MELFFLIKMENNAFFIGLFSSDVVCEEWLLPRPSCEAMCWRSLADVMFGVTCAISSLLVLCKSVFASPKPFKMQRCEVSMCFMQEGAQ